MNQKIHDYLDASALVVFLIILYYALPIVAALIH